MYSVFSNVRTIGDLFRSLKWSWQRATKGYCELDTYSVGDWFLNTLPDMLEEIKSKGSIYGYPAELTEEEWNENLSNLIFLLREANKETCTKVNPYEAEYNHISNEFRKKYGEFGEKLMSDEDKKYEKEIGYSPMYLPSHLPEYKEISELYFNEAQKIRAYQEQCKNEALELFSKYFYSLGF